MTERRRSSFDGHELLLVSTHRQATVMHVLLTPAGASSVLGLVPALTFVPDRDARGTDLYFAVDVDTPTGTGSACAGTRRESSGSPGTGAGDAVRQDGDA